MRFQGMIAGLMLVAAGLMASPSQAGGDRQTREAEERIAQDICSAQFKVFRDWEVLDLSLFDPVKIGDLVGMQFECTTSGYLYFYNVGPDGAVFGLVPSTVAPDNKVTIFTPEIFGPFDVTPPAGTETMIFIFTSERVDEAQVAGQLRLFWSHWLAGRELSDFIWRFSDFQAKGLSQHRTRGVTTQFGSVTMQTGRLTKQDVRVMTGIIEMTSTY